MATVDWKVPANGKLVKFIVENYGVPAAEAALGLSAGTVRGYCFREGIKLGASVLATKFQVEKLAAFCKLEGITDARLSCKGGGFVPGVLGEVAKANLASAQAAYRAKFDDRGVYVPSRASAAAADIKPEAPATASTPRPAKVKTLKVAEKVPEPPKMTAKVNKNVPIRDRVPEVEEVRAMEQEEPPAVEVEVNLPEEDLVKLARLRKKFPNAVSFFKAKMQKRGITTVNSCRTPLWNLDASCFDKEPEKRIYYDDTYVDRSRYVCGNPTESTDTFICRECRRQLGEPPRVGIRRFAGKGDSSAKRTHA